MSDNSWDWLGPGVYFWEQNPARALEYAIESAFSKQFNKIKIKTPFVLGAIIETGNCLNLIEPQSLSILKEAHNSLSKICIESGKTMPENVGDNRKLDCAIFKFIHQTRRGEGKKPYDTIRSAFSEGGQVYPGTSFTARGHIQLCVLNLSLIQGYFLPTPIKDYNPYLKTNFINPNKAEG